MELIRTVGDFATEQLVAKRVKNEPEAKAIDTAKP